MRLNLWVPRAIYCHVMELMNVIILQIEVYQIFYLPAGYYEFTVQGFYRGSYNPAYWDGNEKINAVFFGESVNYDEEAGEVTEVTRSTSSPLLSIASSQRTEGRIYERDDWSNDVEYSHDGTNYYVPNCMEASKLWFDAGYYTDKTAALQYDWTIFSNFQAFYISDASEAVQIQLAEEDFVDALAKADEFRRTLEEAGYYSLLGYYELAYEELENESADYKSVEDYTDGIKKAEKLVADYKSYLADATTLTSLIASCNELAETTSYAGLSQFLAAIEKAEKVEKDEFGDDANGIYTDGDSGKFKLVTYTADNQMTTVFDIASAIESEEGRWATLWNAGGSSYYTRPFANLGVYDGLLYYNIPKAVYVYDPASNTNLKLAQYSGENQLFGMKINDGKVYGNDVKDPNYSGTLVEVCDCLRMGDIEDNGILNVVDATKIQRYLAELEKFGAKELIKADYDHDGVISVIDATAIQFAIAQ